MSIIKNNIYNIVRVSDLNQTEKLKELFFFGYDPTKPIEDQSVQIPYVLFQKVFDTKQNQLVAGDLVNLKANADGTVTISVLHDSTKQNKLVNTDGTIVLTDNANGTTHISAPITGAGDTSIQEDKIAGTKTLQVVSSLVTVTSSAQTNYIGFESKLNSFKLINLSNLEVFVSLDNPQAGANKVIKDALIGQYILPRYSSIEFLKTANGWLVIGLYGVSYFKDLSNASRDYDCNLLVNADGTAKTEEIREIEAIDESSFYLTAEQLNESYPDAVGGFKVITDGALYIKASNYENKWKSLTFTYVE